jgi:hypothetical protein
MVEFERVRKDTQGDQPVEVLHHGLQPPKWLCELPLAQATRLCGWRSKDDRLGKSLCHMIQYI